MNLLTTFRMIPVLLCLAVTLCSAQDPKDSEANSDEWQIVLIAGQRVGYAHITTRTEIRDGRKVHVTEALTHLSITRFQTRLVNTINQVTEEDENGQLLSTYMLNENPPSSRTETRGHRVGNSLHVETTTKKKSFREEIPIPEDVKSATWFDREIKAHPLKVGESRSFKTFESALGKVTTVTVKQLAPEETKLLSGETVKLEKNEMSMSLLPGMTTTSYADEKGNVKKVIIPLMRMETYSCSKEEALKEIATANIDLGLDTLVKVGPIDRAYQAREAIFLIKAEGFDPTGVFITNSAQELKSADPGSWTLKLTAINPGTAGMDPAAEAKYLASSRYLDLADPLIVELAGKITPEEKDPTKIALAAETFVHKHLNLKNYSTALATASEVAASRSGDCTEHGVLLAALLRVKQIPSRVAVGLVYVPSLKAFGGHMWTEAYLNGRWVALDATLAKGRGDAMHIKTGDTALEDSSSLPIESFLPLMHSLGRMQVSVDQVKYAE